MSVSWTLNGQESVASLSTLRLLASVLHEEGKLVEAQKLFRTVMEKAAEMPLLLEAPGGGGGGLPALGWGPEPHHGSPDPNQRQAGHGRLPYGSAQNTPAQKTPGHQEPHRLTGDRDAYGRSSTTHTDDDGGLNTIWGLVPDFPNAFFNEHQSAHGGGGAAGNMDPSTHNTLPIDAANGLALLLLETGPIGEAVQILTEALDRSERAFGLTSPSAIITGANLAVALRRKGLATSAADQCRHTLPAAETRFGPQHVVPLTVRECLSEALLDMNQPKEAEGIARALVRLNENPDLRPAAADGAGRAHGLTNAGGVFPSSARLLLVRILERKGELDESEALLKEVLRDRKAAYGVNHQQTLEALTEARKKTKR